MGDTGKGQSWDKKKAGFYKEEGSAEGLGMTVLSGGFHLKKDFNLELEETLLAASFL